MYNLKHCKQFLKTHIFVHISFVWVINNLYFSNTNIPFQKRLLFFAIIFIIRIFLVGNRIKKQNQPISLINKYTENFFLVLSHPWKFVLIFPSKNFILFLSNFLLVLLILLIIQLQSRIFMFKIVTWLRFVDIINKSWQPLQTYIWNLKPYIKNTNSDKHLYFFTHLYFLYEHFPRKNIVIIVILYLLRADLMRSMFFPEIKNHTNQLWLLYNYEKEHMQYHSFG